jgi:type IV pilus assembly protein PilO
MCVLVGAGLFATFGLPHWLASSERTRRIAELKVQQQSLLLIDARVKQEQQKLVMAQQQQDLVVNLVAGRGEIETFLTQLSRTAAETAVVIERYAPVPDAPVVADSSRQENKKGDAGGEDNAPSDLKGYEKTSVLLQVRGPYVGVLQFLRAMETLELLVQPSDLELKAVPLETNAEGAPEGPPLTDLKLRLSFFDKTTDGDPEAKELMESAPQSKVLAPS